jgi:hypothetical protein
MRLETRSKVHRPKRHLSERLALPGRVPRLDSGAVLEHVKAPCDHIERRSGGASDSENFVGDVLADRAEFGLLFEARNLGVERV